MQAHGASRPRISGTRRASAVLTHPPGGAAATGARRGAWLAVALLGICAGLLSSWTTAPALAQAPSGQPTPAIDTDLQRQAIIAGAEAFILRLQRDFPGALAKYEEVLSLYRRAGDREGEAKTFDDIAAVYEAMTEYQRAISVREEGLAVARMAGARSAEAQILKGLSQVRSRLGQYRQARDLAQQSLTIARALTEAARARGDSLGVVTGESLQLIALSSLTLAADALGDYGAALDAAFERLELARDRIGRANAGEEGISLLANQGFEQQALNSLGSIYGALGQHERALDYFTQAFRSALALSDIESAIVYQNNIAYIHSLQGRLDEALALYLETLEVVQELEDRFAERVLLDNIGTIYLEQEQYDLARDSIERSLVIARALGDRAGEGTTLNNLGSVALGQGDFAAARSVFEQALALGRETGYRDLEQTALNNLAVLANREGRLEEALDYRMQSIEIAESVRTLARIEEFKTNVAEQSATTYESTVRLLGRLGRSEEAFETAERGRARSFLDQLGNARPDLSRRSGPLAEREEQLRGEIGALDERLRGERSAPQNEQRGAAIQTIDTELTAKQTEYADVLTRLRFADPEAASLVSVSPLSLEQVQSYLDDDTTLLSYFVTPDTTFAFVVTRDSLYTIDLAVTEEQLREALDEFRAFDDLDSPNPAALQRLSDWLIAPLRDQLTTQVVGIVPSSVLHYVPFAALKQGQGYFGDQHTLFTLPSASTLPFIQAKRKAGGGPTLAMAQARAEGLPTLRWADVEAQVMADLENTSALTGPAATETAFKGRAGRSRFVHVAAHGELNPRSPLFSRIFLAPDAQNDGSLDVGEVYELDLAETDLVVLSACETQLGVRSRGDDIVGLNRAFLYAGAPTVVASLWSVNDRATAIFMTAFYEQLNAGFSKADALRSAQAATRQSFPHPFYWAAFVLTGDPGL